MRGSRQADIDGREAQRQGADTAVADTPQERGAVRESACLRRTTEAGPVKEKDAAKGTTVKDGNGQTAKRKRTGREEETAKAVALDKTEGEKKPVTAKDAAKGTAVKDGNGQTAKRKRAGREEETAKVVALDKTEVEKKPVTAKDEAKGTAVQGGKGQTAKRKRAGGEEETAKAVALDKTEAEKPVTAKDEAKRTTVKGGKGQTAKQKRSVREEEAATGPTAQKQAKKSGERAAPAASVLAKESERLVREILGLEARIRYRHACERLSRYNVKVEHVKQTAFHRCPKRNRWVFGGNRTGKTECGAVETVWRARGIHPYRPNRPDTAGWVISVSRDVQREVAQAKILDYLDPEWIVDTVMESGRASDPRAGVINTLYVRNVFGGVSSIGFKSCEMGRDKFQGASLDYVWFDEEPPEDIYDECRMRVVDRVGDLYGTMTPLKGLTFVYRKIFLNEDDDPEIWHETMEWRDNPFLDPDEIERLSAALDRETLDARRYGKFSAAEGLVYPEFDQAVHVIEPFDVPLFWQDRMSIDPGLNNPLSCHWYAVDGDGTVFVVAEHYMAGKDAGYHIEAIKRISEAIGWHTDANGRYRALIDAAANQRTLAAEKSVAQLFFEGGIAVDTHVDKALFAGINRVKAQLRGTDGRPGLYIFSTCVNLIRELKSYFWHGDAPFKKDDHALDELRYYLMSRPQPSARPPKPLSEAARFKQRLLRGARRKG